jgi:hypothetical protein
MALIFTQKLGRLCAGIDRTINIKKKMNFGHEGWGIRRDRVGRLIGAVISKF